MPIKNLFSKHIKNTEYGEEIDISHTFVCTPRKEIQTITKGSLRKVFISTRSLKHIYDRHVFDKKMPRVFYKILNNLVNIISNQDKIYLNSPEKRGDYIFVKEIDNQTYMCTVEIIDDNRLEIVSSCTTGEKYLSKFTLLWS